MRASRIPTAGAVCAALWLSAGVAQAEEISVVGERGEGLPRVPGSGASVGEKEIARARAYDVAEVLGRVPGVLVRQDTAAGQRLDISVRGLDAGRSRRVLVLEDGVPVSANPYGEPDLLYAPPIERIRAIEVVKGSGNIRHGPQTIGGVVNFLTWEPPHAGTSVLEIEGGSRAFVRGLARVGDAHGTARWTLSASGRRGAGFRGEGFESHDAFGKVAFATRRGEVTVKVGFHEDAADADAVGLTRDLYARSPRAASVAPDDRAHLRRIELSAVHVHVPAPGTELRTLVFAHTLGRLWRRQSYTRTPAPGATYDRVEGDPSLPGAALYFSDANTILDRVYDVAGVEERVEHRFSTGALDHTLSVGARALVETASYEQRLGDTATSFSGTLSFAERHRTIGLAAFAEDRLAPHPLVVVTIGIRVEHARLSRTITRRTDESGPRDVHVEGSAEAGAVLPGFGFVVGTRSIHAFAGLHAGWAPPRVGAAVGPSGASVPLSSERSVEVELGGRGRIGKIARGDLTLFGSSFQNQVVANGQAGGGGGEIDGGPTRRVGVETQATLALREPLEWDGELDVRARYTEMRASFVGGPWDGLRVPYAPDRAAGLVVEMERTSGLGATVTVSHVAAQLTDARNTVAEDASGTVGRIPPRTLVDVGVHRTFPSVGLTSSVSVKNALDESYVIARRPEGIFAGPPRQVLVGLAWRAPGEREAGRP